MHEHILEFALLGPLEARRGSTGLDLGPPKRRVLLTRLLIEAGRPVPVDRLCEDLWEGQPPSGAVSSLHAHVSRLRDVLEPHRGCREQATVLVSGTAGYSLNAPHGALDTSRFEAAVHGARLSLERRGPCRARREIEHALSLWRGGPLADAANYAFTAREIGRLEESRLAAEELRATILIHQGDFPGAVIAAEELTRRDPLREAAWTLLLRALYLSDRPAEAVRRYEHVRGLLTEELGVDPGPALRRTHLAILRQDTEALAPAATAAVLLSGPSPAGLPDVRSAAERDEDPGLAADPKAEVEPDAVSLALDPGDPTAAGRAELAWAIPGRRWSTPRAPGRVAGASVAAVPNSPRAPLPVVERAEELARLDEVLHNAAAGQTSWVVLSGEAGIGRTRLAEDFAARAADTGFAVAWARCGHELTRDSDTPELRPVGQLLSALDPRRRFGTSDEDTTGGSDVTRDLVDLLSRRPTVCVIDDLHCASDAFRQSLALLATVLRGLPLVVLCTVQDGADDSEIGEFLATLIRRGCAATLALAPLTVTGVQELVDQHTTPRGIITANGNGRPPKTPRSNANEAADLHRLSGGNPFVLTELLKLPAGRRTGTHAAVPASIRRVLKARLAGLEESVRALLDTVAVADGRLDPELVTHVRGTTREQLVAQIDAAVTAQLLVWEEGDLPNRLGGGYQLPELLRQVILSELTASRRQVLHAALAHALSELPGGRHDVRAARHLVEAGPLVPREDLTLAALNAGRRCALDGRYTEARTWFQQAAAVTWRPDLRDEAVEALRVCERRVFTYRRSAAGSPPPALGA